MNEILSSILFIILSTLRIQAPLTLGALGGMYSEKSGVVNIAIDGLMLIGCFFAVVGSYLTGSPWIGILFAVVMSMFFAFIHAVVSIKFKGNQNISGTAINTIAGALTIYLLRIIFKTEGISPAVNKLPMWGFKDVSFNPIVYFSIILVFVSWFILNKTRYGLHLRSAGEHPQAADSLGINVEKVRYFSVILSGAFSGLAGACLSIGDSSSFLRMMTSGRGFMALAILIIGKWKPINILVASLLFSFAEAFQIVISDYTSIPSQFTKMIPYLVTLIVLTGFIGRSVPPAAVGKPYNKGER